MKIFAIQLVCLWVSVATLSSCARRSTSFGLFEDRDSEYFSRSLASAKYVKEFAPPVRSTPSSAKSKKKRIPEKPDNVLEEPDTGQALEAIEEANEESTNRSEKEDFVLSTQYFDYVPGEIYEVVACPGLITTLVLKPGEQITSIASGDTHRWDVQTTTYGSRPARMVVLVKPAREWIETNLVLTTNVRMYQVSLKSVPGGVYNATVIWRYPNESMIQHVDAQSLELHVPGGIPALVPLTQLDFDYVIEADNKVRPPKWMPVQVFNDGHKTYIKFPNHNKHHPVLFALGGNGKEVINYRVHQNTYIVDKVLFRAQLGEYSSDRVRIEYRPLKNPKSTNYLFGG